MKGKGKKKKKEEKKKSGTSSNLSLFFSLWLSQALKNEGSGKEGGTPSNRFSLSVSYEEASFAFCVSFSDSEK